MNNDDNREMVELIKNGYGNLNMDQKQQILKFVLDDFELCGDCVANCGLGVFAKEGDPIVLPEKELQLRCLFEIKIPQERIFHRMLTRIFG